MSKFDEHFESRAVANSSLQQSSFVFFPEEELLRRAVETAPETIREEAFLKLDRHRGDIEREERFVRKILRRCAATADVLASDAEDFAQTLPKSLFGAGGGDAFMLPLGLLFEQIQEKSRVFSEALLDLDIFWTAVPVDFHYFLFLAELLPDEELKEETDDLSRRLENNRIRAQRLSERIGNFRETVIDAFFDRAGKAADLDHNGAGMRFGALAGLCGELRYAAQTFSAQCREKPKRTNES